MLSVKDKEERNSPTRFFSELCINFLVWGVLRQAWWITSVRFCIEILQKGIRQMLNQNISMLENCLKCCPNYEVNMETGQSQKTELDRGNSVFSSAKKKIHGLLSEWRLTSESWADVAVPRLWGSIERSVSIRLTAVFGNSLHLSRSVLSYGCLGLNIVASGSLDFFQ